MFPNPVKTFQVFLTFAPSENAIHPFSSELPVVFFLNEICFTVRPRNRHMTLTGKSAASKNEKRKIE
jgi:hypothetical protein